jgi:ABC-type antimicrobial peptide transport system permease subunit
VSGLYGVLTFTLGQRIREIGIRMALGATAEAVVRLITGQAARLVGLGALVGLALSYGAMGLLSAVVRLQNVSMLTPGAFLAAAGFALAGAAAGSYLPARRATRVDPAITLRADG